MHAAARPLDPRGIPLFWLHGMLDGNGGYVDDIVRALDPNQEVWTFPPAGYDGARFPDDIRELAARQLAEIRAIRPRGPYHVGGFCNGAVTAFEVAQGLVAAGERVASLTLISPPAWHDARPALIAASKAVARIVRLDEEQRVALLLRLCAYHERALDFLREDGSRKSADVCALLQTALRKATAIASAGDCPSAPPDLLQYTYDRYIAAIKQYVPEVYPGPLDVIWGHELASRRADRAGGWRRWGSPTRNHYVEGGHFCALESPADVASVLRRILGTERHSAIA